MMSVMPGPQSEELSGDFMDVATASLKRVRAEMEGPSQGPLRGEDLTSQTEEGQSALVVRLPPREEDLSQTEQGQATLLARLHHLVREQGILLVGVMDKYQKDMSTLRDEMTIAAQGAEERCKETVRVLEDRHAADIEVMSVTHAAQTAELKTSISHLHQFCLVMARQVFGPQSAHLGELAASPHQRMEVVSPSSAPPMTSIVSPPVTPAQPPRVPPQVVWSGRTPAKVASPIGQLDEFPPLPTPSPPRTSPPAQSSLPSPPVGEKAEAPYFRIFSKKDSKAARKAGVNTQDQGQATPAAQPLAASQPKSKMAFLRAKVSTATTSQEVMKALGDFREEPEVVVVGVKSESMVSWTPERWKLAVELHAKDRRRPLDVSLFPPCPRNPDGAPAYQIAELYIAASHLQDVVLHLPPGTELVCPKPFLKEEDVSRRAYAYLRGYGKKRRLASLLDFPPALRCRVLEEAKMLLANPKVYPKGDPASQQEWIRKKGLTIQHDWENYLGGR